MENDNGFYKDLLDNMQAGVYSVDRNLSITYWSKGAERISGFSDSEVLEKKCSAKILRCVDDEGKGLCRKSCPLAKTLSDGIPREVEVYIHHQDGHQVPALVRVAPILDTKGRLIGGVEIFSDNSSKIAALQKAEALEKVARIDLLTGLANRRHAEISLRARLAQMREYRWTLGVLLTDIDRLEEVNDRYGEETRDEVLRMVGRTLAGNLRSYDLVGRWNEGGFVSIVICVNKEQLDSIGNRFRAAVERSSLLVGPDIVQVTISVGATLARPDDTTATLLARADELMSQSKASGGNCVSMDS